MTSSTANRKPTVAVIGGGLAGISAGSALADAGYHIEIFERRPYLSADAHRRTNSPELEKWSTTASMFC